nr:histidinol-phosphatase HisJ family protein [bacterium]
MIRADQHVHTFLSPDSDGDSICTARRAQELGLTHLTITEHVDLGHPLDMFNHPMPVEIYRNQIAAMRAACPGLHIGVGLEVGYIPQAVGTVARYVQRVQPLDFALLSVHVVDGLDPYDEEYFVGRTREDAYRRYLEVVLESMSAWEGWHSLAHIGYVWKYCKLPDPVLHYAAFPCLIDEILRRLIGMDRALEINTSAFAKHDEAIPASTIVARYYELGGRLITIGSDAHSPEKVGQDFERAEKMLRSIGFTEYAVYVAGNPVQMPF